MMQNRLLRPGEVCERLSIDNETMHRWVKLGKLRAVRFGPKSTRIYESSLNELLEASEIKPDE